MVVIQRETRPVWRTTASIDRRPVLQQFVLKPPTPVPSSAGSDIVLIAGKLILIMIWATSRPANSEGQVANRMQFAGFTNTFRL